MKIYTKTGDLGDTGLFGGPRVSKADLRIKAYGAVDELNGVLGWVLAAETWPAEGGAQGVKLRADLTKLQSELFQLGAELATPSDRKLATLPLGEAEIGYLEGRIDLMESSLEPLRHFILPGGSELGARIHMARTVSRRAEREMVELHRREALREDVLKYINRVSDYLFVCARFANLGLKVQETPWIAPR